MPCSGSPRFAAELHCVAHRPVDGGLNNWDYAVCGSVPKSTPMKRGRCIGCFLPHGRSSCRLAACETISWLVKYGVRYADCFSTSRMIQSHTSMGRCASCMASTRSQRCARSTRRHASESPSCRWCSHRSMRSALQPASAKLLALMCFMASPVLRACAF